MATRQVRLSGEKLDKEAFKLINTWVTLVLKNRSVLYGMIDKVDGDIFYIKDARLKKHQISLKDISEIIRDIHA